MVSMFLFNIGITLEYMKCKYIVFEFFFETIIVFYQLLELNKYYIYNNADVLT
ncbi:hypothetical protein SAMN06298216_4013 [Spirosomataceae bacterium TFI 002]|nr:hypothetical protein SAMN06298216_4013 [Spirosomataceae bacterium TFI 002]